MTQKTPPPSDTFFHLLTRRKTLILSIVFFSCAVSAFILQQIRPVYTAEAQIAFENKDENFVRTQVARIGALSIMHAVILELNLAQNPELQQQDPRLDATKKFKTINPYRVKMDSLSPELIAQEIEPAALNFRKNFSARLLPNSYVIDLHYNNHDPQKAAYILNKIIVHYLKQSAPEKELRDFQPELDILNHLKISAESAEKEFEDFKLRAPIMFQPSSFKGQRESSDIMPTLKSKQVALEGELAALSKRYGHKHPKIIEVKKNLSIVKNQIRQARENMSTLKNHMQTDESARYKNPLHKEKHRLLESQAQEAKRLYDEYAEIYVNYKTAHAQTHRNLSAHVLAYATPPITPSFPKKTLILCGVFALSLLFSILLVLFLERTRNNFLSGKQLERALTLPCFALIPKVEKDKNKPPADYVIENPSSSLSEAVRSLRLALRLNVTEERQDNKVITVTSSFPNEGKSTLSAWLGQLAAKSGERVILIDADLRRPSIHKALGQKNTASLAEYLGGQSKLEEVIDETSMGSGLHVIYGRSVPNSALDLISSERMEQLVRTLRKSYDLIIIDSPACLAVADAKALARLSDQLLYAVQWNKTKKQVVHNGIVQFDQFKNLDIATVLTNIDLKKHVKFGYGEAINYYGDDQ